MTRRILLVEDEQDIAELAALHLSDVCDEVTIASDGHEGLRLATSQDWALIVLDLRLPGPDGLEICEELDVTQELVENPLQVELPEIRLSRQAQQSIAHRHYRCRARSGSCHPGP